MDGREKQPPERRFEPMIGASYEVELKAWPYNGIKSKDVISRKLIYEIAADNFKSALSIALVLQDTVRAMHDIWVCDIVRIQEIRK